jgi:hypothetical protein
LVSGTIEEDSMVLTESEILIVVAVLGLLVYSIMSYAWSKHQCARDAAEYKRGYDYAKKALLENMLTPSTLLNMASTAFDPNQFDAGIKQAVWDHQSDARRINELTS